jgi:hypothetical protein
VRLLLDISLIAASVAVLMALWEMIAWLQARRSRTTPGETDETTAEKRERH